MRAPVSILLFASAGVLLGAAAAADEPPAAPPAAVASAPPAGPAAQITTPAAQIIAPAALQARLRAGDIFLLDVRTAPEFAAGHIDRAVNVAHDQLAANASRLPADKDAAIAVYCRSGRRSALAIDWLRSQGYRRVLHLEGDFLGWQAAGLPIAGTPPQP